MFINFLMVIVENKEVHSCFINDYFNRKFIYIFVL